MTGVDSQAIVLAILVLALVQRYSAEVFSFFKLVEPFEAQANVREEVEVLCRGCFAELFKRGFQFSEQMESSLALTFDSVRVCQAVFAYENRGVSIAVQLYVRVKSCCAELYGLLVLSNIAVSN